MAYLLPHLLTESAQKYPEKEALRFKGDSVSYAQLDRWTNQLARALISAGVRRGDRVGIYLHKSFASVISVFAIMKAGGVYVPLDPNAPVNRLAYITRNCDVEVLLVSSESLSAVPQFLEAGTPLKTLVLTDSRDIGDIELPKQVSKISWEQILVEDPGPAPDPGTIETDLAYILYTSGSTGDPKGVMISHRTIFTFVNWCVETFHMSVDERVTSHAPLHFDLSTFDLYATIKAGGTVVLVPESCPSFLFSWSAYCRTKPSR